MIVFEYIQSRKSKVKLSTELCVNMYRESSTGTLGTLTKTLVHRGVIGARRTRISALCFPSHHSGHLVQWVAGPYDPGVGWGGVVVCFGKRDRTQTHGAFLAVSFSREKQMKASSEVQPSRRRAPQDKFEAAPNFGCVLCIVLVTHTQNTHTQLGLKRTVRFLNMYTLFRYFTPRRSSELVG